MILKKPKLTLSSLFWWLERPSLLHHTRCSSSVAVHITSVRSSFTITIHPGLGFPPFWQTPLIICLFNALIFTTLKQWLWWRRRRPENVTCPRFVGLYWTRHASTICLISIPSEAINDHKTSDSEIWCSTSDDVPFLNRAAFHCRGNWKAKSFQLWSLEQKFDHRAFLSWEILTQTSPGIPGLAGTHLVQKHSR